MHINLQRMQVSSETPLRRAGLWPFCCWSAFPENDNSDQQGPCVLGSNASGQQPQIRIRKDQACRAYGHRAFVPIIVYVSQGGGVLTQRKLMLQDGAGPRLHLFSGRCSDAAPCCCKKAASDRRAELFQRAPELPAHKLSSASLAYHRTVLVKQALAYREARRRVTSLFTRKCFAPRACGRRTRVTEVDDKKTCAPVQRTQIDPTPARNTYSPRRLQPPRKRKGLVTHSQA